MKKIGYILLASLSLVLVGCKTPSAIEKYDGLSDVEIYDDAHQLLKKEHFQSAAEAYEALEAHYPFGDYTQQGQLDIIYAYYRDEEYPAAVAAADRFIRLHPRSPYIDYAYYMKGLVKFNENVALVERIFPLDPNKRDVGSEREAYIYFEDLLRRFPNSEYAADARQRLVYIRNSLSLNEYYVGQYYFNRGAYLSAANRATFILEEYPGAPITPDALILLINSYKQLGLTDLAEDATRVLKLNYPER